MSYPLDNDPWGDYSPASTNQGAGQSQGYNNSYQTTGLSYGSGVGQQYQYEAQGQYGYGWDDSSNQQQTQDIPELPETNLEEQTTQMDGDGQLPREKSAFRKFIGAHIPICGSILDTCSSINLPFIDALVQHINRDLLVSKMFYFFFYSAFGSLFPLMGVYFKQLGMNPFQVGILTGVRPFIEIFSAPFWNNLAERFHKSKALLIFSLVSWIIFTYSLAHIHPPASACIAFNDTDYTLFVPYSGDALSNVDVNQFTDEQQQREAELEAKQAAQEDSRGRKKRAIISDGYTTSISSIRYNEFSINENPLNIDLLNDFEDRPINRMVYRERRAITREPDDGSDEAEDENSHSNEDENGHEVGQDTSEGYDESKEISQHENKNPSKEDSEDGETKESMVPATTTTKTSITTTTTEQSTTTERSRRIFRERHKTPPTHIVGKSPITVEYAANYNKDKHSQFVTPMFSTVVYKLEDIKGVFFLLLLLICLGEFFSAPALTLADSATLRYLGENIDLYCRQRMFGSLSWAITLLLVGMALDNATSISDHPCGPHLRERSYTVCFIIFSLLMACALLTATQFRFDYPQNGSKPPNGQAVVVSQTAGDDKVVTTVAPNANVDDIYASTQPRSIFNTAPPINEPPPSIQRGPGKDLEFLDKWKSAVFAQRTRELPNWVNVFRQFSQNPLHLTYLFITWFLGCGVGLVFTFLFWHLQDVGGSPTLFGICSVINHISEIFAYFFSFSFIKRFGHTRVSYFII